MSVDWVIETHESVRSTQETVKGMAKSCSPEGTVVQALKQEDGRGRFDRRWESPEGNLYISVLLRPSCYAQKAAQLSFVASLALSDVIDEFCPECPGKILKWPNDILIDGLKCAGILLETELTDSYAVKWLVLGVGVNISSAPDVGAALQDFAQGDIDLSSFRDAFLRQFGHYYALWNREGFEPVRSLWLEKTFAPGTKVEVKNALRLEQGLFHDIDRDGNLLLTDEDLRVKKISAGDAHFMIGDQ